MLLSKLFRTYAFLSFCAASLGIAAQEKASRGMANVVSTANCKKEIARKGQLAFEDSHLRFHKIPKQLQGLAFIRGFKEQSSDLAIVTPGQMFVVTPAAGHLGSQEFKLQNEGFERLNISLTGLFNHQNNLLVVYSKKIAYKSFRLPTLSFQSWAIVFSSPDSLPSRQIAAELSTAIPPEFNKNRRRWQGCPSIEKTGNRLWAAWFSGGSREPDAGNYGIISFSDDNGLNWHDPAIIITHPDTSVRVIDPQLWKDPDGTLWVFWVQNQGAHGFDGMWCTWAVQLKHPNSNVLVWTRPRRLCNGLTRNKPIVLRNGNWLLPSYSWVPNHGSNVYVSTDKGKTWVFQGGPSNDESQNFYEHMIVELKDKRLWLLQRNIQESYSIDEGKTWTHLAPVDKFTSANSRLYLGRLRSGSLLLVYNDVKDRKIRRNLTAFVSTDDGRTWPYKLVIDDRTDVSYPDVTQGADGRIYLCYDRGRTTDKEIILSEFTEEDVVKGKFSQTYKPKMISKVESPKE